jgi:hypothetical protein
MKVDSSLLEAALIGYQSQMAQIEQTIAELRSQLGHGRPASSGNAPVRKRRKMSAAARKRIAAAQKKRWAEYHKNQSAA